MFLKELIRIVSDGTKNTKVIDAKTGETIGGIKHLKWEVDAEDQVPRCTITAYGVPLDAKVIQRRDTKKRSKV